MRRASSELLAAVGLFLILGVGPAFAHASLVETTPLDGQEIEVSPRRVTLTFNEPINAPTGGLRVFDGQGERVDGGIQEDLTADTVSVDIGTPLEDGGYVATYRVVSEDGHVIRGAFSRLVAPSTTLRWRRSSPGWGHVALARCRTCPRPVYGGVLLLAGGSFWLVVIARRRMTGTRLSMGASWRGCRDRDGHGAAQAMLSGLVPRHSATRRS